MTTKQISARDVLADLLKTHRAFYADSDSDAQLGPIFIVYRTDGPDIAVAAKFESPQQKSKVARAMRELLRNTPTAYMVAFICEGWTISVDLDEIPPGAALPVPSDSDRRIEVVMTTVETRDGEQLMDLQELVRDWQTGKVVELKPQNTQDGEGSRGRFMNLFGEERR